MPVFIRSNGIEKMQIQILICYTKVNQSLNSNVTKTYAVSFPKAITVILKCLQAKIELCKYKDVGGLCCGRGSVTIDWTVEKSGYVPGEDIIVNGAIQNESQETVATSKVALNMVSTKDEAPTHVFLLLVYIYMNPTIWDKYP